MTRPLLIGEAPARTTPPGWPPFYGRQRSAKRLWEMGLRVTRSSASGVGNVDAVNLIDEYPGPRWPAARARDVGRDLLFGTPTLTQPQVWSRTHVLLVGRNVADAFGALTSWDWFEWFKFRDDRQTEFAIVPHPSGLNRWWNEPKNAARARAFFEKLIGRSRDAA